MENVNAIWLYLEPYVFISEDEESYLFYNADTKKGYSFKKTEAIISVVKKLQDIDNLYSVKVSLKDLLDDSLFNFVETIQSLEFGDIIEGDLEKPILLPPILNLQRSVERLKEHNAPIGENILTYLHEVNLYLTGECLYNCATCLSTYKQQLCCTKTSNVLDFEVLKKFLFSISYTGAAINLLGGNVFSYPDLKELFAILVGMNVSHTVVVDMHNIPTDVELLKLLSNDLCRLKLVIRNSNEWDVEEVFSVVKQIEQFHINQQLEIYVSSIEEYDKAELINERLGEFSNVNIRPFYNGTNRKFFEESIFIDQEELDSIELTRQNIFAYQALNVNDFGKITIMSDGTIYANVNEKPIGYIEDPIKEVLCKELESGTSWRRTRYNIEPCSQCRFKLICPSPSNYERVIGQNNLCHIR